MQENRNTIDQSRVALLFLKSVYIYFLMFENFLSSIHPEFWPIKGGGGGGSREPLVCTLQTLLYAVKAQTSLAPLSRFRGSRVTTAHAHQCCRFQSYAKTVPSRMKLTKREPTFLGSTTTDHVITACDI